MRIRIAVLALALTARAVAQDAEVLSFKSGISLTYQAPDGGTAVRGTHFAEEYLFSSPENYARKIIYIHDDTRMVLAHNANNLRGKISGVNDHAVVGVNGADGVADVMLSGVTALASTDVFTSAGHGRSNGQLLQFVQGTGFAGIKAGIKYYVVNATTDTFQLSLTSGGAARNITSDGSAGYFLWGDAGLVRYRIDGDMTHEQPNAAGSAWWNTWYVSDASQSGNYLYPAYVAPITFAGLSYPTATKWGGHAVVGRTGDNGAARTPKVGYAHYGHVDDVGDEWHTIDFADDDYDTAVGSDWTVTDGVQHVFVVNPKTPCLTWRATGNGEWYTTPAKVYFLPKIHDQTTFFNAGTGTVTCEIADINGNDVFYRIVTSLESGTAYTDANADSVTLDQDDFPGGTSYLQYYFAGNAAYTKTRTVVKDPGFASSGESHGYLCALDADNVTAMQTRKAMLPYSTYYNRYLNGTSDAAGRAAWSSIGGTGRRLMDRNQLPNAILLLLEGPSATQSGQSKTYGRYALEMLLDNARTQQMVGFEMSEIGTGIPCRPMRYRGYWDCDPMFDAAFAYDIIAAHYRSDQVADGMTPIQERMIRDCLAEFCVQGLMGAGTMRDYYDYATWSTPSATDSNMWDGSLRAAAAIVAMAMPSYSTSYYGTSGLDGVTTTTYEWTPYPDYPLTWLDVFFDDGGTTIRGYPNYNGRPAPLFNWAYYIGTTGNGVVVNDIGFADKTDYASLVASVAMKYLNPIKKHVPTFASEHSDLESMILNMTQGDLYGTKLLYDGSYGPRQAYQVQFGNEMFPSIADVMVPAIRDPVTGSGADDSLMNGSQQYALAWYDVFYSSESDTTDPTVAITSPTSSATYSAGTAATVTLGGNASDSVAVLNVSWSNSLGGSGTATFSAGTGTWSAAVPLSVGSNVITVTATDTSGNTATPDQITVTRLEPVPDPLPDLTAGEASFGSIIISP